MKTVSANGASIGEMRLVVRMANAILENQTDAFIVTRNIHVVVTVGVSFMENMGHETLQALYPHQW